MLITKWIKKKRLAEAINKTEVLMSSQDMSIVTLSGKRDKYEDYFNWLSETHPDWTYVVACNDKLTMVSIEKKKV